MTAAHPVLLLAGAVDRSGEEIARAVLAAGGRVAAAVARGWQVDPLREQLSADGLPSDNLLVGAVSPTDAEAAAGFVKGANDALGPITHFAGVSMQRRNRVQGREPAGDFAEMLDGNLHANATLARAVLPSMRSRRSGVMVFIAPPSQLEDLSTTCRTSIVAAAEFAAALRDDVADVGIEVMSLSAPTGTSESLAPWITALMASTTPS